MSDDQEIDLSRYRTSELASTVAEILAVPEAIRTVLGTTCYAVALLLIANSLTYTVSNNALIPWLLSTVYALAVAVVLGFVLGLIRVAGLFVSRSERVLQLTLETSQKVSADYRAVSRGHKRMPCSTEVVEHVYYGVVLPAMEASVARSLGIVGTPLLWVYRRTIGGVVGYLIIRMKTASLTDDQHAEIEYSVAESIRAVGEKQSHIESSIQRAQAYTSYAVRMLRRTFLYPVRLVFGLVALVAVIPLGLCWYWTR